MLDAPPEGPLSINRQQRPQDRQPIPAARQHRGAAVAPKRRPSKSTSRRWTLPSQQPSLVDVDLSIQLKNWLLPPRTSRCYGHAAINKPRLTAISAKQDWLTNYGCAPTNAQPVPLWALHPRFPCVFQEMPLALSASPCLCSTPRSMLNSVAHLSMFIG